MEHLDILDITQIEPRRKHPTIFEKFDSLSAGEAFIINNDHDPKPLYYQLMAERGQTFMWEDLESGPQSWRIKIQKRAAGTQETIGEMVKKDFRRAQVFKKLGIDFCCGGKKTLEEACKKKGIDIQGVEDQFNNIMKQGANPGLDFDHWELDFLADYIINTHHQYAKDSLPFIKELASKVARVHGIRHPETIQVSMYLENIARVQVLHLMKEENIIFPYIKQLAKAKKHGSILVPASFGSVSKAIQLMEVEHDQTGEDMAAIRNLTSNFKLPTDACTSFTVLYKELEEYENDLINHVHLENNILFPKAIELEKELA